MYRIGASCLPTHTSAVRLVRVSYPRLLELPLESGVLEVEPEHLHIFSINFANHHFTCLLALTVRLSPMPTVNGLTRIGRGIPIVNPHSNSLLLSQNPLNVR